MARTIAALVLVAGCSNSSSPQLPPGCAEMLPTCLANQKVCVAGPQCQPCPTGQYASTAGSCQPIEGDRMEHDFGEFTAMPGEEILGLCQSWTLNNSTELWVNAVELEQNESSHHSNWIFVPDDKYPGADGIWRCRDRGYDQLTAALAGGVLYAQSTQAAHEVQRFPNGGAIRIPPWSRVISDVHILNAARSPVTGRAKLSIYTRALADVKVKLAPFHITFETLDIPPHATARFTADCEIDSYFQSAFNHPLDLKLYYALPHTHALGRRVFLEVSGGPSDGKDLFDVSGFNSEARGRAYDPPIDLTGADGLRFGCEFENPRDQSIQWGFGDQEMCEILGFADGGLIFESAVTKLDAPGMDGSVVTYGGPCGTLAFKYDFNKPGGPPR